LRFGPSIWSAWQFETAAVPAQLGPAPSERPREPVLWSWQRRNDNRARATGRAVLPQPSWCAEKHAWRGLQAPDSPRFLAISPSPGGDASRSPRADHRANPGVVLVVRARWRARRHTHGKNAMPRRSRARVLHLPPLSKNGPVAGLLVCPRLLCGAWRAVPRTGEAIFADRTMGLEATVTHDDQSAVNAAMYVNPAFESNISFAIFGWNPVASNPGAIQPNKRLVQLSLPVRGRLAQWLLWLLSRSSLVLGDRCRESSGYF